jgi:multisubunit Na+/H+ antiporter MnhB subunit
VPQAERQMATVGLLLLAFGVLTMRRTGGKPLKILGFTVLTMKQALCLVSLGGVLVVFALMLANPGEN